ncbi:MAG: ATP-binding protein [Candidatus Limnocylindria bacterium]
MIETSRPSGFLSLGQPTARTIARQSAERGRIGRTLLVHGPVGSGKGAFVDDILALLFCAGADPGGRPCNACRGCRDARARTHSDLVIGSPEGWREQRSSGESIVSVARRWLLEAAGAPVTASRRIVLIEHADRAGEQIQNALLKALEEPTDRHTFILVADEPRGLLPTIRSRCQPLRVGAVPREELTAFLMDVRRLPADQAEVLARISNGLTGTALSLADDRELLTWRRRVQAELLSLLERGRADRFGSVRDLLDETVRMNPPAVDDAEEEARTPAAAQRRAAISLVEVWLSLTRDLMVAAAGRVELAPSRELAPELDGIGGRIGTAPLTRMAARLEQVHAGLLENAAPKLALEAAMVTWPFMSQPRNR